jgi:hypothetical protein
MTLALRNDLDVVTLFGVVFGGIALALSLTLIYR